MSHNRNLAPIITFFCIIFFFSLSLVVFMQSFPTSSLLLSSSLFLVVPSILPIFWTIYCQWGKLYSLAWRWAPPPYLRLILIIKVLISSICKIPISFEFLVCSLPVSSVDPMATFCSCCGTQLATALRLHRYKKSRWASALIILKHCKYPRLVVLQ